MVLKIPNWDARFETAQSRAVKAITWTPIRHSFAIALRMQPPDVAAAMLQIVLLGAQMPERGTLHDGGRDLTIDDVATYVGADSTLIAKAMSALGACYQQKEGRKEEKEGGKDLPFSLRENSSAAADARLLRDIWNRNRGPLPEVQVVNASRAKFMAALVREAKRDEALIASTVAAFASDPFNAEKGYGIDTLCRARGRSKWLERGRNGWQPPRNGRPGVLSPADLEAWERRQEAGE